MCRFIPDEKVNGSLRLTIPDQTLIIILLNKTQINLINPSPLLSSPQFDILYLPQQ